MIHDTHLQESSKRAANFHARVWKYALNHAIVFNIAVQWLALLPQSNKDRRDLGAFWVEESLHVLPLHV